MKTEILNRISMLFPGLSVSNKVEAVENSNTLTTDDLWSGVSDKFAEKVSKIVAPLDAAILDISTDIQLAGPDILPVVKVETVNSVGSAIKDASSWDDTAVNSSYTNV